MTHEYALTQLLALGALNYGQLLRITGWPLNQLDVALTSIVKAGTAFKQRGTVGQYGGVYQLRERKDQPRPSSHSATFLSSERSSKSLRAPPGTSRTA